MLNRKISFLQSFGIILVVLGHTNNTEGTFYLRDLIYTFHMPLFVFISGYLLKFTNPNLNEINLKEFVKKKIKRLLIPYVVISTLAYIPKFILNKFAVRPVQFSLKSYIEGLVFPWDNPIIFFWFLPTIFLIMLVFIFLNKMMKNKIEYIVIISLFFNLISIYFNNIKFLNISGVLNYLLFFTLGIFYCNKEEKINGYLNKYNFIFLILSFISLNINLYYPLNKYKIGYIIIATSGILMSLILEQIYRNLRYNFLDHLNGRSFSIYLLSWFPQVFVRIVGYQLLGWSMIIVVPISFVLGVYIPVIVNILGNNLIKKYSKLNWIKYVIGI